MTFVERSLDFEIIGQHNDGLRAALAFVYPKPDRLGPVCKQAAAMASRVLDDSAAVSVPLDKQAGQAGAARRSNVAVVNHGLSSIAGEGPGPVFRPPFDEVGARLMGWKPGQQFGRQAESERDHQQQPEAGEHLQGRRRVDFAGVVTVETVRRRIVISIRRHSVP
jgi:hypothetical protein